MNKMVPFQSVQIHKTTAMKHQHNTGEQKATNEQAIHENMNEKQYGGYDLCGSLTEQYCNTW